MKKTILISLVILTALTLVIAGCKKTFNNPAAKTELWQSGVKDYTYLPTQGTLDLSNTDLRVFHDYANTLYGTMIDKIRSNWDTRNVNDMPTIFGSTDALNLTYLNLAEIAYNNYHPGIISIRIEPDEIAKNNLLYAVPILVNAKDGQTIFDIVVERSGSSWVIVNNTVVPSPDDFNFKENAIPALPWSDEVKGMESFWNFYSGNTSTLITPKPLINYGAKTTSIYNRINARTYAYTYGTSYNPSYRSYASVGGDCANFASQTLTAGGLPSTSSWYYTTKAGGSSAWVGANTLATNLLSRGAAYTISGSTIFSGSELANGDLVFEESTPDATTISAILGFFPSSQHTQRA